MQTRIFLALMISLFTSQNALATDLHMMDGWVRQAPPGAMALGAFMTLHNTGDKDVVITSMDTDAAKVSQIHKTIITDGVARMVEQERLVIPAGEAVALEPGGLHLMLMGPKALKAGESIDVNIVMENGDSQQIQLEVRKSEGGGHEHHHHSH